MEEMQQTLDTSFLWPRKRTFSTLRGKIVRRTCSNCGQPFEALRGRAVYCSGRCRAEASRRRRMQGLEAALDEAERALGKVRRLVWGQDRGEK